MALPNGWQVNGIVEIVPNPNSGDGNAYGHGRATEVHAALAAGISPSTLDSHGEKVSAMVKAVQSLTGEKPGRGVGRNKGDDGE